MSICKCFLTSSVVVLALGVALYPFIYRFKAGCQFSSEKPIDLTGRLALITGPNTGIGYETALELVRRGCHVILACRDATRCAAAKSRMETESGDAAKTGPLLSVLLMDLSDLESVRTAAGQVQRDYLQHRRLDYLILNAGVMALPQLQRTKQGHEMHFGVNHLGHFLLTRLLLPRMKERALLDSSKEPLRVVSVSSMGHYVLYGDGMNFTDIGLTQQYSGFHSYAQSKLANVLHMRELASREVQAAPSATEGVRVIAVSLHPGAVATELGRYIPFYEYLEPLNHLLTYLFTKTPWEGAQTTLHCVLTESRVMLEQNGEYFHDCVPSATTVHAHSIADAKTLWELSEKLVKDYVN